jgi:hypothetical protein
MFSVGQTDQPVSFRFWESRKTKRIKPLHHLSEDFEEKLAISVVFKNICASIAT